MNLNITLSERFSSIATNIKRYVKITDKETMGKIEQFIKQRRNVYSKNLKESDNTIILCDYIKLLNDNFDTTFHFYDKYNGCGSINASGYYGNEPFTNFLTNLASYIETYKINSSSILELQLCDQLKYILKYFIDPKSINEIILSYKKFDNVIISVLVFLSSVCKKGIFLASLVKNDNDIIDRTTVEEYNKFYLCLMRNLMGFRYVSGFNDVSQLVLGRVNDNTITLCDDVCEFVVYGKYVYQSDKLDKMICYVLDKCKKCEEKDITKFYRLFVDLIKHVKDINKIKNYVDIMTKLIRQLSKKTIKDRQT